MNSFRQISILQTFRLTFLLLLVTAFVAGCGDGSDDGQSASSGNAKTNLSAPTANTGSNSIANDDTAALAAHVLLPIVPEEVKWREEQVRNSDAKKLVAVLKYPEADANNLVAQAGRHRPAEAVEIAAEDWFPEELVAQSQMAGDDSLRGNAYAAGDFLQMPYKTGRLVKIENSNYFVLELSTQ
jgi:hypothetical protein